MKIEIYKNPNGDTRTAPKDVTFEDFQKANDMHRTDVWRVMYQIADMITTKGARHDWTKKEDERQFYSDFMDTIHYGYNFVEGRWYQEHIELERHHLFSRCPDDVNLLDVIEMIVDCICAGKARSGEVRSLEISDDILKRAVENTVKLVDDMVVVKEMKEEKGESND